MSQPAAPSDGPAEVALHGPLCRAVDLGYELNASTVYWPGGEGFCLCMSTSGASPAGGANDFYAAATFSCAEHGGTHVDGLRAALPATEVVRKIETKPEIKPEPKAEVKIESKTEPKAEPKIEPRPAVAEKPPVTAPAAEAVQRDANLSDTRWLAAVRQAIVAHQPAKADDADEAAPVAAAKIEPVKVAPAKIEPAKVEPRLDQVLAKPAASPHTDTVAVSRPSPVPAAPPVQLQPTWNVTGQPATSTPVTEAPAAVTTARDDHPVPPASIPVSAPGNGEARPSGQSRIGSWIAEIPLVGRVIEPRGN